MLEDNLIILHDTLAPHFKPGFLQRELTTFQFRFEDGEPFYLTVTEDGFMFTAGEFPSPTVNLYLDCYDTCRNLISGKSDGMAAFMAGKYRADGHIVLSQLLLYLFKPDDPTNIYEVQD